MTRDEFRLEQKFFRIRARMVRMFWDVKEQGIYRRERRSAEEISKSLAKAHNNNQRRRLRRELARAS